MTSTALPKPVAYGSATQALHWLAALAIVAAWGLGLSIDLFPRGPARAGALSVHFTLGLLVFSLALLRILGRLATPAPAPHGPAWMVLAARLDQAALYAIMLALPITGMLDRWTSRAGTVTLIGGWNLTPPFALAQTRFWGNVHEPLAYALAALVAAHVGAALFHHLVLRDGILRRMLPAPSR